MMENEEMNPKQSPEDQAETSSPEAKIPVEAEAGAANAIEVEVEKVVASREQELEQELEGLRAQLEKAQQEHRDGREKMMRVAADADNQRKRLHKEREDFLKYGHEGLFKELLAPLDNLERTMTHLPDDCEDKQIQSLRQGLTLIIKQFHDKMAKYHVKPFSSLGEPFDPNLHEALNSVESNEALPGTVLSEFQRGYMLHDRLLRPALVTVAREAKPEQPASEICSADTESECPETPTASDGPNQD